MAIFLVVALSVLAQNFTTCDRWSSWDVNDYTIYNNIWGDGAGTQCLWAYGPGNWGVWADHPNTGGIKSYPNVDLDVNYTVSSMPTITASFNTTTPGWGSYNTAFDIWYNNYQYEIMIWANWAGSMGPISYNYGCNGYPSSACPIATNVNVGGHTWNLYEGTNGSATVYSFLRTSHTNSGTVNITQISQWLASNGYFGWNTNLHEIQFGFEITHSAGGADFRVNSYSVNIGTTGGGGSGTSGYVQFRNRSTGMYLDGMGRTANGSACGQWANTNHQNSHWEMIDAGGGYYRLRNRGTGLYLDGQGRTTNGADCGQWANTNHQNAHWAIEQFSGGYYRLRNRVTGRYLDGMGRTTNGANVGQWANTSHNNAQWQLINVNAARLGGDLDEGSDEALLTSEFLLYPNPSVNGNFTIEIPESMKGAQLIVFDQSGRELLVKQLEQAGSTKIQSHLKPGMYLINVSGNGKILKSKLLVK